MKGNVRMWICGNVSSKPGTGVEQKRRHPVLTAILRLALTVANTIK